ncbi:MAG: hypothetical protein KAG53_04970 [Endozoicomonadaceae bacterium]|nr:hypothetical protein [Endozoicomonadaceae bacterium]
MICRETFFSLVVAVMLLSGSVTAAESVRLDPSGDATETQLMLYTDQGVAEQAVPIRLPSGQSQLLLCPDYFSWQMDSLQLWTEGESGNHYADSISWFEPPENRDQLIAGMLGSNVEVYRSGVEAPSSGKLVYWRNSTGILQWASGRQEVFSDDNNAIMIRSIDRKQLGSQRWSPPITTGFSLDKPADVVSLFYINKNLGYQIWYQLTTSSSTEKSMTLIHDALLVNNSDSDYRQAMIQLASGDSRSVPQMMLAHSRSATIQTRESQSQSRGDIYFTAVPGKHDLPPKSRKKVRLSVIDNLNGGHYYQYRFYGQSQPGNRPVLGHPVQMIRFTAPADLPAGRVRVFNESRSGRLFMIGESVLEQSAAGSQVLLGQGEAYTIELERTRLDVRQQVNQLIVSWQLIIRNRKTEVVQLRITDEDRDLLKIDQLKGVELAEDGALTVDLVAGSEQKVYFSTVYQRKQ